LEFAYRGAPEHCPLVLPPRPRPRYTSRESMPKRRKPRPRRPQPVQLPLFPETASLVRIRPEHHEWRYYRMEIWPDLFGRALLVR
jgi:hypothetical protein